MTGPFRVPYASACPVHDRYWVRPRPGPPLGPCFGGRAVTWDHRRMERLQSWFSTPRKAAGTLVWLLWVSFLVSIGLGVMLIIVVSVGLMF